MTAAELAWITAIKQLTGKVDKPFTAHNITLTREKMTQLANTAGRCRRELRHLGTPSTRLEPVYASVTKACQLYHKAARCFARAANVSGPDGSVVAGTPEARIQRRSLSCGFAAQGNASNRLGTAESQAQSIESQAS
jgi:hypothetical protein